MARLFVKKHFFAASLFAIGYPVKFFMLYNLVVTVVKIVSSYWISDRSMNLWKKKLVEFSKKEEKKLWYNFSHINALIG